MPTNSELRARIHSILDRVVNDLVTAIQGNLTSERVQPAQFLPKKAKPLALTTGKKVLIQFSGDGFKADLPDGRMWYRKRERDLARAIRNAGFTPIGFKRA